MGSLVNWASKLSSPNSPEMLGLKGGTTCFCSSWNNRTGIRWETQWTVSVFTAGFLHLFQSQIQALFKHFQGAFSSFSSTVQLWTYTFIYLKSKLLSEIISSTLFKIQAPFKPWNTTLEFSHFQGFPAPVWTQLLTLKTHVITLWIFKIKSDIDLQRLFVEKKNDQKTINLQVF